jgi:hypothetical protein
MAISQRSGCRWVLFGAGVSGHRCGRCSRVRRPGQRRFIGRWYLVRGPDGWMLDPPHKLIGATGAEQTWRDATSYSCANTFAETRLQDDIGHANFASRPVPAASRSAACRSAPYPAATGSGSDASVTPIRREPEPSRSGDAARRTRIGRSLATDQALARRGGSAASPRDRRDW